MSVMYYPAVFHEDLEMGGYWVEFYDLPGCFSQGETIQEAIEYSKEALGLYLDTNQDIYERTISNPTRIQDVMKLFPNEIVLLVEYDPISYARKHKTKAVKKTLTIPEWLNEEATSKGINFSQVLQEALINKLMNM